MGWKGTIRSINAAAKRVEKHNLQVRKQEMKEYARYEVENYEEHLEELISFHLRCSKEIDWTSFVERSEPTVPTNTHSLETDAQKRLDYYKPNFVIKFFKLEEWRKKQLAKNILKAKNLDEIHHDKLCEAFIREHLIWKTNKKMAERILSKEIEAYEEFLSKNETFMFFKRMGTSLKLNFIDGVLDAEVEVRDESIIPRHSKKLLASGKISEKEMPISKFNSLYQDHVCSIALRVAREITALFPLEVCVVSAKVIMLNKSTGHLEDQVILTAYMPRHTMTKIDFSMVDPSDAFKNFKHRMFYKSNEGFSAVAKIKIQEIIAA